MQNLRKRLRVIIPAYPTFNVYSAVANRTTALGPVCIATAVRDMGGWDTEVIDENNLGKFGPRAVVGADHEILEKERPAKVAALYGGLTSTIPRLFTIARFYHERKITVVAGGAHFCKETAPEALENGIDYVIIGEGENTMRQLLQALEAGNDLNDIQGIAFKDKNGRVVFTEPRVPRTHFSDLAMPDFSLVRYAHLSYYPIERIRGCGMECEFCTVKGRPRPALVERTMEHIAFLVETRNAASFFIVDDLFGQDRLETLRLCRLLKEYQERINKRLDFTVQIRLDKAKDDELLTAMRAAGISTICIGFESPIEEELKAMKKRIRPGEMVDLARIYHKYGFLVHGMFIFGYPSKEPNGFSMPAIERMKRYQKFFKEAKLDTVQVLLPVPLPGTEFRARLLEQGRVFSREDIGWEYYDGNFPLFVPDAPLTVEDMHAVVKGMLKRFYKFRNMLMVGVHVFSFPSIILFFYNFQRGWNLWYRGWRNSITRFGGWLVVHNWMTAFRKDSFTNKINSACAKMQRGKEEKTNV